MSLYGIMRTSVSGMSAQANRLATVAENVANVNTNGYKRASREFSSLLLQTGPGSYESGSINTTIRYDISGQGSLLSTTSVTDLAISGDGFFVVSDPSGSPVLTRAGAFVPNGDGELVNAAGFRLMGYRLSPGQPSITVNGYTGLENINLSELALTASASTEGNLVANLPASATAVAAPDLPSANGATATYTAKSSLTTYDNLGGEVLLDLFFTKTAGNTWEVAAFNKADAPTTGEFPYAAGPLTTATLDFDPTTGGLSAASANALPVAIPSGSTLNLDLSQMTQLATGYTVLAANVNGNAPSGANVIDIGRDGLVYATYDNGTRVPVYRIPLAHVTSPDRLTPLPGNVYRSSADSGNVEIGFAQTGALGDIVSSALEQSTVDLANELTSMIDAQRSYSANSKVFQTGSELMDLLVNLKR
ncbi:MAG: flagellar hook protein FlgE [Rhizobiales bacterium]|nr:flagellar hook protein FlgE [Hyphomicrobiales bacterium]MBI3672770.1 flagellar hook protein FlgE [Hyphomicrobiales bacterium]